MSRKYGRQRDDSLVSVVGDSVHIAAKFGPIGALTVGAIGFLIFYAILPLWLTAWTDANKAKLTGPLAIAFANMLDQVVWYRFIVPCQWTGIAILFVCGIVAARKFYYQHQL